MKHRFLIILLCITFVFSSVPLSASSGTINESEPNNTYQTADVTYNDYDNYGYISSTGDVDWWKITFTSAGMANYYLGSIPSGCNYNLYLYESNGTNSIAISCRTSNKYEQIRCHVNANTTYYLKVFPTSTSGISSTDSYKLRVKNYSMHVASFNSASGSLSPYTGDDVVTSMQVMGWSAINNLDQSATSLFGSLLLSRLKVINVHGAPGHVTSGGSRMYAVSNSSVTSNDSVFANLVDNAANKRTLIIFASCFSGLTDPNEGNLVDEAVDNGIPVVYGWPNQIGQLGTDLWLKTFFSKCAEGRTIKYAEAFADIVVQDEYGSYTGSSYTNNVTNIQEKYYGSTDWRSSTVLFTD